MSYIEIQPTVRSAIAQWLEHLTVNQKVVGSSPARELRYFSE